ncbi:unnamed protein product [Linum trigynum]|uniref:Uncharacterized protein n=1 Tax=Linum trigynum TaxID=586398 RepID=A0AAV2G6F8_9ROSI
MDWSPKETAQLNAGDWSQTAQEMRALAEQTKGSTRPGGKRMGPMKAAHQVRTTQLEKWKPGHKERA